MPLSLEEQKARWAGGEPEPEWPCAANEEEPVDVKKELIEAEAVVAQRGLTEGEIRTVGVENGVTAVKQEQE